MSSSKYSSNLVGRAFSRAFREILPLGVAVALLCFPVAEIGYADDGGIDKSFGTDGIVSTNSKGLFSAQAMRLQKDDKIVVGGSSREAVSGLTNFALVRYNPDGSLDAGFGNEGIVTTKLFGESRLSALAIQADGKILSAGWSQRGAASDSDSDFALVRYLSDGTLDPSFGDGGKVVTDFSTNDGATAIAIQSDGKIVLAGFASRGAQNLDFALARYNGDGSLDKDFGEGGKVQIDFHAQDDQATSLSIQRDGRIVVVGSSRTYSGSLFVLARYNRDGSLDPSFGDLGTVTTDFPGQTIAAATGLVLLNFDETIVVSGTAANQADYSFAIAQYRGDGSLDESFGEKGRVSTGFVGSRAGARFGAFASSIAVQKNGKIVVGGSIQPVLPSLPVYFPRDIALARYNSNGSLDVGFGSDGRLAADFQGGDEGASAIAIQPDGNILAAGARNFNAFAVIRFLGDSVPVPRINSVSVKGKDLLVSGRNFGTGANVYVNDRQHLVTPKGDPPKKLRALRAALLLAPGETAVIVVENTDGTRSREFQFTRIE
jgi:uncharacterized delta-60 repeat protein